MHYLRALIKTIQLTIKGEGITHNPRLTPLVHWMKDGQNHLETTVITANNNGWNMDMRKAITLRIDSRDVSVETILNAVDYHLRVEYPRLMKFNDEHSLTVIYASNMNDQYRVSRLRDSDLIESPGLQHAISELARHLESIPPSNSMTN